MISGGKEFNQLAQNRSILEAKFGDDHYKNVTEDSSRLCKEINVSVTFLRGYK